MWHSHIFETDGCVDRPRESLADSALSSGEPPAEMKSASRLCPIADPSGEGRPRHFRVEGLPTTMLYDRQGTLRKKVIGFEYTDAFESALKPLL